MREYKGIDIARVFFACFIPFFHINFPDVFAIHLVREYVARLGVPFFFAVSGMFLTRSCEKNGSLNALKRYVKRIGRILIVWLIVYSPIIIHNSDSWIHLMQQIVFMTPSYLWFLSGLIFASIPFCLVKNRQMLFMNSVGLYLIGTLFGGSYRWLMGDEMFWYYKVFLTTRNGLFFGLPLMCVGELSWRVKKSGKSFFVFLSLFYTEVTLVSSKVSSNDDTSMYFFLPFVILHLIVLLRDWNPDIKTKRFSGISTAIYVMQFGVISACQYLERLVGGGLTFSPWITLILTIFIPFCFYFLCEITKLDRLFF